MKAVSQVRDDPIDPSIRGILNEMDEKVYHQAQFVMCEDDSIITTVDIIEGLKIGNVPGTAVIRWKDGNGILEANVIDFLLQEEIDSVDVETGEELKVKSIDVPDGVWHLYS